MSRHQPSLAGGAILALVAACHPDRKPEVVFPSELALAVTTDDTRDIRTHLELTVFSTVGCDDGWSRLTAWQAGQQVGEGEAGGQRPWTLSIDLLELPESPGARDDGPERSIVVRGHCGDGREVVAEPLSLPPTIVAEAAVPTTEWSPAALAIDDDATWLACGRELVRTGVSSETVASVTLAQPCILGDRIRMLDDVIIVEHADSVEIFTEGLTPRWHSPTGWVQVDPSGKGAVTLSHAPPEVQSPRGWATVSRWSLVDAAAAAEPIATWEIGTLVDDGTLTPRAVGWDGERAWMIGDLVPPGDAQPRMLERWSITADGEVMRGPLLELEPSQSAPSLDVAVHVTEDTARMVVHADGLLRLLDLSDAAVLFEKPWSSRPEIVEATDLWIGDRTRLLRLDHRGNLVAQTDEMDGWHLGAAHPTGGVFIYRVGYAPATGRLDASLAQMWTLPSSSARVMGFDANGRTYVHAGRALFVLAD